MNNLISRQVAMLKIARVDATKYKSIDDFHDACVDCLLELPFVQPEQRWIPVSENEKLPDVEVLCCDDRGEMLLAYPFECSDSDTGYAAESDGYYMYNVVAWMPKPKPYKEEK